MVFGVMIVCIIICVTVITRNINARDQYLNNAKQISSNQVEINIKSIKVKKKVDKKGQYGNISEPKNDSPEPHV